MMASLIKVCALSFSFIIITITVMMAKKTFYYVYSLRIWSYSVVSSKTETRGNLGDHMSEKNLKNYLYLCFVVHIFIKISQNMCLINTHARCNYKLWKAL